MRSCHRLLLAFGAATLAAACTEDPRYVRAPMQTGLEVGIEGADGMIVATATRSIDLPVAIETMEDATARATRAAELGVDVPYVRLDDLSVSIEWTIKNLSMMDGVARIDVNGASEYFAYIPTAFVFDPEEDEEPPPLMGDIPINVPALGTRSGTFREDQVREASLDLEQITRAMVNPFAAMLTTSEDVPGLMIAPATTMIPQEDLGLLVRYDLILEADQHMVMEYQLRVRDHRGILHEDLLFAPAGELTTFAPQDFMPPPPPPE